MSPHRQIGACISYVIESASSIPFLKNLEFGWPFQIQLSRCSQHPSVKETQMRCDFARQIHMTGGGQDQFTAALPFFPEIVDDVPVIWKTCDIDPNPAGDLILQIRFAAQEPERKPENPGGSVLHQGNHGLPEQIGSDQRSVQIHAKGDVAGERIGHDGDRKITG